MVINTWSVSLMRHGVGIVKWTKSELDAIDRKTREVMTVNMELNPRSHVDRFYISRMEGRRALIGFKMCVKAEENSLGWYVKHRIESLIVTIRERGTVPSENSTETKVFKQQDNKEKLNNWRGKAMYGQYVRKIEDKDKRNTWKWLRKSNLKGCTEGLICTAQKQALRTNYVEFYIDKTGGLPLCRMCRVENEAVSHIVSEYKMLAQKEYKKGMTIHSGIFIGNYVKNMAFKVRSIGTSMNQMDLLRAKGTRFCGILQSSVIRILKLDDQILLLLIKLGRKLRS